LINEHGQQLLDEERVAFGRLHDTTADVTRKGILQQILDQRICVALGERLQSCWKACCDALRATRVYRLPRS